MTNQTPPTASPANRRRILLISGGVVLAFGLYLLAFLLPDVLRTVGGPTSMSLAQAAGAASNASTYARLEDGVWDCASIAYVRGPSSSNRLREITRFTEAFLTDGGQPQKVVVLATMSGEMNCAQLNAIEPTGYLNRMDDSQYQELANEVRLVGYAPTAQYLEFCGYCGQDNSLIGTIFGFVIFGSGLALLVLGLRMPRQSSPTYTGEPPIDTPTT